VDGYTWRRVSTSIIRIEAGRTVGAEGRNEHETVCPRCGADAEWSFPDREKTIIEVLCPDCGRYEISREEFDLALTERAGLEEPER
jgi:predicted RNA-binding Zn-ribbon protein involved in translation (DUF1610 family)